MDELVGDTNIEVFLPRILRLLIVFTPMTTNFMANRDKPYGHSHRELRYPQPAPSTTALT